MTRVLVVDDDPEIRFLIQVILGRGGEFEISEAIHGQAALNAIDASGPPEIVVTDLMMPVMSGMELIRRLRDDARMEGLRILVVSSNVDAEEGDEIRGAVDGMLSKDRIYSNLLAAVRSLEPNVEVRGR